MSKPRYRILTTDELQELEKEFVEFLVVNGVTAPEWQRMKQERKQDADQMLVLFSDVVFEGIMRKTQFLEWWEPSGIRTFHCLKEEIIQVGVEAKPGSPFNFLKQSLKEILDHPEALSVYQTSKPYHNTRELEIFNMMEQGCQRTDGALYKKICMLLAD